METLTEDRVVTDEAALDDASGSPAQTGPPDDLAEAPSEPGPPVTRDGGDLARNVVSALVLVACCGFVFWICQPRWVFTNTTPTGGDMGAHVWGPAYLRDHLLPQGRVAGWTPDWYAGFPAYSFYMVLPSLAIVAIDVGVLPWWSAFFVLPAAIAAATWVWFAVRSRWLRFAAVAAPLVATTLLIDVPYNIAFKLVAISGVVLFPAGVWWFGKGLDLRSPGPELMAIASVFFLVDKDLFSIYGGNIASTMAGEFAFSMSLTASMFFLGTAARGMKTGRHRALGAVLFAVTALCHVIPMLFATLACALMVVIQPRFRAMGRAAVWALTSGAVGGLLAAFWYIPFYGQSDFLNDMGWEKLGRLTCTDASGQVVTRELRREFTRFLLPLLPYEVGCPGISTQQTVADASNPNMWGGRVIYVLAAIGVVLAFAFVVRAGMYLFVLTGCCAVAFWLMPQLRFWNARVLPFFYLGVYLLAAIGLWLAVRTLWLLVTGRWTDPPLWLSSSLVGVTALASFVMLGLVMHALPFGVNLAASKGQPTYGVLCSKSTPGLTAEQADCLWTTTDSNPVRGWAEWNFRGLELKGQAAGGGAANDLKDWIEYKGVVDLMSQLGRRPGGCGRAYWEYDNSQNKYGSTMAMMLLPYWTDSCIGSMEGLYFEASSTTPFHFLVQSELSDKPSRPMRMDEHVGFERGDPSPYQPVNVEQGVTHLQMLGVRYFLTYSKPVDEKAAVEARLTKVGESGPWKVYEVADAPLVSGLAFAPAVWTDVSDDIHDWVKPSIEWFNDPSRWDVMPATSGPSDWPRVSRNDRAPEQPTPVANVTNVKVYRDAMSFDVDRIGTPVLVRASYFPNWDVSGADGPYRVGPNLMVVVPRSNHVELDYGRSGVEIGGTLLSLLGLGLLLVMARRERGLVVEPPAFPGDRNDDADRFRTEMATYPAGSGAPDVEVDPDRIGSLDGAVPVPVPGSPSGSATASTVTSPPSDGETRLDHVGGAGPPEPL